MSRCVTLYRPPPTVEAGRWRGFSGFRALKGCRVEEWERLGFRV